jgi:Undecaprenyl-phosphate galactose phosphotransferase WbaP
VNRRGSRGTAFAEWALVAVMVVVATGATALVGAGRTGYRLDLVLDSTGPNLFRGTEAPAADWWYPLGVSFTASPGSVAAQERMVFEVTKTSAEPWSRLQQIVRLEPGQAYVLSVSWRTAADVRPGFDGWGHEREAGSVHALGATWIGDTWRTSAWGDIVIAEADVEPIGDDWFRGHVSFRYDGPTPVTWYVGAVPDRGTGTGTTTSFAELQLVEGVTPRPYMPAHADRGLADLRTTRLPLWQYAADAIAARPWLGWGPQGYPRAAQALHASEVGQRPLAAHAHSLVLDVWVERGLLGLAGLVLLAGVLALRVVQQRDRPMAVVLVGVALLNLFETTLFNGAVLYPLAAVLGWRAVGWRPAARTQTGFGSAAAVRLALAGADVLTAMAAISVAAWATLDAPGGAALATVWTPTLVYATLLWPAFAWASGLYPGYGRALRDELARGVRAAAAAAVTLGSVALVLPGAVPLGARGVVLAGLLTTIAAPLARMLVKAALRAARLWGRPVAILGTGPIAARVTRYLLDHPGVGLHPVVAFGDADWDVPALPVTGRLEAAWQALPRLSVQHAIVTPESAARIGYDEVLRHAERSLRFVQFVPDLHGVPASSVVAAPLGTILGLEVRNQLASRTNRAVKRAFDLVGAAALLVVLSPLLLAVALWIRLDTRGPAHYLSPRVGRYGRTFHCVKFRTMHVDAEARLARMLALDPKLRSEYERYHKLDDDPRVTRAGRWLRRFSLDELAQLLNVVAGDMSLVGPRPYLVRELSEMGPERDLIFLARPGMTGYWQVEGRNDVTFDERQTLEAAYVRNWSVWWDVELMLRTPVAVLARRGK